MKTSTDPGNTTSTTYGYEAATHQATSFNPAGGSLKATSYAYT